MGRIKVLRSLASTSVVLILIFLLSSIATHGQENPDDTKAVLEEQALGEAANGHTTSDHCGHSHHRQLHGSTRSLNPTHRAALLASSSVANAKAKAKTENARTAKATKAENSVKTQAVPTIRPFHIPSYHQSPTAPVEPATIPNRPAGCKKLMWFTAVGSMPGAPDIPRMYKTFLMAALMSALRVAPSLEPHLIYDGPGDPEVTQWWRSMGGIVHYHHLSFYSNLETASQKKGPHWLSVFPTFLRIDIPLILANYTIPPDVNPTHVLYTDSDVMFLKDVHSCSFPATATISMGPEHEKGRLANAGVMYMNVSAIAQHHAGLVKWGDDNQWPDQRDQTLILKYFEGGNNGGLQQLKDRFNWKGYWGRYDHAVILHFHGPKPLRCLECYILHSRNLDYCYSRHYVCYEYSVFWTSIMQDGGRYYKELLSEFYYYVGLATSPMI